MKAIKRISITFLFLVGLLWLYSSSLIGVDKEVKIYYQSLKKELRDNNYKSRIWVISGRRWKIDNYLLNKFANAAPNSKHKKGQAIDILVLDINKDGKPDAKDVDLIYQILDKKIIKDKGGIGTYKNSKGFFSKQMIHFDCRGNKARWNK